MSLLAAAAAAGSQPSRLCKTLPTLQHCVTTELYTKYIRYKSLTQVNQRQQIACRRTAAFGYIARLADNVPARLQGGSS